MAVPERVNSESIDESLTPGEADDVLRIDELELSLKRAERQLHLDGPTDMVDLFNRPLQQQALGYITARLCELSSDNDRVA